MLSREFSIFSIPFYSHLSFLFIFIGKFKVAVKAEKIGYKIEALDGNMTSVLRGSFMRKDRISIDTFS